MKKKCILFITLLVTMLCGGHRAMAQSVTIDGITYRLEGGNTVYVADAENTVTQVVVQSGVTINGMVYPVTSIGPNAFQDCSSLISLTLPNGITSIGNYAFQNCSSLTSLTLPNGLTSIGNYAFAVDEEGGNGGGLRSLELPASIQSIGYNAFPFSLSKLTCNAVTPPTVKNDPWGGTAVYTLGNVSIVYVPSGCRSAYKSVYPWSSKVILDGTGVTVSVNVSTPGTMGEEILNQTAYLSDVNHLTVNGTLNNADIDNIKNSMPNLLTIDMSGVDMTNIPRDMFNNRKALLNIILPNNLESIGGGAFYNCINLESIVLPEGVTTIEDCHYYNHYGAFQNCTSLKTVSFPHSLKSVGSHAFSYCSLLDNVNFKEGLNSIGRYAFYSCRSLKNISFPKGVASIRGYAFAYCTSLREIELKEGLTSLGYYYEENDYSYNEDNHVFYGCSALESVIFPSTLKTIGNHVFQNCSKMTSLTIPEGISAIGTEAFGSCTSLTDVTLPSTLVRCANNPFRRCGKLEKVTCMALIPPTLYDGLLSLDDMGLAIKRTLYVPEWTLNKYKLTSGWAAFAEILPLSGVYPASIDVYGGEVTLTLPNGGLPTGYKPDMNLGSNTSYVMSDMSQGSGSNLHLAGGGTMQLDTFKTYQCRYDQYSDYSSDWWGYDVISVFLTEPTIVADAVVTELSLSSGNWHFLSFPYDVKVEDIVTNGEWVIRYYDGAARAQADYNNTWVTVPYDGTLYAGQGYIWSSSNGAFTVPAVDNANKNLIFANNTRYIPLTEYASEYTSNNSWNLIGNPFPCYYDTRFMEYTAPITVWDRKNRTYVAYSPVDDSYILSPLEAFFVQRPVGVDQAGFKADGRQTSTTVRTLPVPVTASARLAKAPRQVFNMQLTDGQRIDRTRFVINADAQMAYEVGCDAAKFMSSDVNAPQLFTLEGTDKMAINERPLDEGKIALGIYVGAAGIYTLSLETVADMKVTLVDQLTGTEVDMAKENYTFEVKEAGNVLNRFVVILTRTEATSVDETSVHPQVKVIPVAGGISVIGADGMNVAVYTAAGAQVDVANGASANFNVTPGLYVVKVGDTSFKVSVSK